MKTFSLLIVTIICFTFNAYSQTKENNLSVSLNVGRSAANRLTKDKPAQVLATFPGIDSLPASWLLDSYLEMKLNMLNANLSVGFVGEIHKNTLIGKEQDISQFGLSIEKDFIINKTIVDSSGNKFKQIHTRIIASSAFIGSFDYIKDYNAFQANVGFTISLERGKKFRFLQPNTRLINISKGLGKVITLSHNHHLGLVYIGGKENILLGDLIFELNLFPLSGIMYDKIKQPEFFCVSWLINARKTFYGSTTRDLDNFQSLIAGINYKFNNKTSLGLSYSWQQGANPYIGLDNQSFQTLMANFRVVVGR